MRVLAIALALLLVPILSGCIFALPQASEEPASALASVSVTVTPPEAGTHEGVLGLWVPDAATALHITWTDAARNATAENVSASTDRPAPKDTHANGPSGILAHFPNLLTVLDPDGTRLYVGTPAGPLDAGGDAGATAGSVPRGVVVDGNDPAPGLYQIVLQGQLPPPRITVEVPIGTVPPELLRLPVQIKREVLVNADGSDGTPIEGEGTWTPPNGTVAVWGELLGIGVDARMRLHDTGSDTTAFSLERTYMAAPTALGITWSFDFTERWHARPDALTGGPIAWEAVASGVGVATAYAIVAEPIGPPTAWASLDHEDDETVPYEGRIDGYQAAHLTLPEGGALVLRLAESGQSNSDHVAYRIYDATGNRLAWGSIVDETAPLELPPGPLAILNDGPGRIEVAVVGAAPSDAALYPLDGQTDVVEARLGDTTGGSDEVRVRHVLQGPAVGLLSTQYGTVEGLWIEVQRDDGTHVASAPDRSRAPPQDGQCCASPLFTSMSGVHTWIDAGTHHITFSSTGGRGDVDLRLTWVDLSPLLAPTPDGN